MAKFSDVPYFILSNYFTDEDNGIHKNLTSLDINIPSSTIRNRILPYNYVYTNTSSVANYRLKGGRSGIIAKYGFGVELYVKIEGTYYRIKVTPISGTPIGNIFSFNYEDSAYRSCELTIQDLIDANGSEVYFKKDHQFNDYIDNNTEYKDYLNTNKLYYYFGKLYISATNRIDIVVDTFKDFVINALPYNNRGSESSKVITDSTNGYKYDTYHMLMSRFLELYFDRVFSKNYNLLKNIWTLSDPFEVDYNYLYYISNMYGVDLLERITEKEQREYVNKLPDLLKRKGTYVSLFIIWKILTHNTVNYLNIYERWHDWDVSGSPLDFFDDYLYISYPSYNKLPPSEGAGSGYYYDSGVTLSYFDVESSNWYITHSLNEKYIFTQFIDNNDEVIIPNSVYFSDYNNINVLFDTPAPASSKAVTMTPDNASYRYQHDQTTASTTWSVNHNLNTLYPIVQVISSDYLVIPSSIYFDDANNLTVTFSSSVDGVVIVGIDNNLYTYTQAVAETSWSITHSLNEKYPIVQVITADGYLEIPDTISFIDKNSLLITFTDSTSGSAVIFSNTEIVSYPTYSKEVSGGQCLSPHYKVEMDLSSEPLGDNFIIDENLITELINNFEKFRPVSRFSHYHELIAPITDFTGKNIPLYTGNYTAAMFSKCYQPVTGSIAGSLVYATFSNSLIWNIEHNLNSLDVITQCYSLNKVLMEPKTLTNIDPNRVRIEFSTPIAGYAHITTSESTSGSASETIQWTIDHTLNYSGTPEQWNIIQINNESNDKLIPLSIVANADDQYTVNFSTATDGYSYAARRENEVLSKYVRTDASDEWNIYHGLNANAIQAQFYDDNDMIIYPKSFTINDANSCTVTFNSDITGLAVIRKIGISPIDMDTLINTISYAEVGSGTSGRKWNPEDEYGLENSYGRYEIIRTKSDSEYYYYEIIVDDDKDMDIYEIGLFDINNNIAFYTYNDLIYKPSNVVLTIWYRIKKDLR